MGHLSLVKNLSHLKEEQKFSEEVWLEHVGAGFTRGTLTEIVGETSSGRTSLLFYLLSKLTREGEVCAIVDTTNSLDPYSAVRSGVVLENVLWIKCGREIEKAFTTADYLAQAKGFGVIWLNLNGVAKHQLNFVPRTFWYRYRNRIKKTPTLFVVTAGAAIAGSASHQSFLISRSRTRWSGVGRFKLLRAFYLSFHSKKQFYGKPTLTKVEFDYRDV